jgi:hypothetical protein
MGREALTDATCTFLTDSDHEGLELFFIRRERTNLSSPSAHPHFHRRSHPVIRLANLFRRANRTAIYNPLLLFQY